jgi:serine/threonine protein kinase
VSASLTPVATETEEISYSIVQEHTLIGKIIGNRYRVLREVGSGGMAWVYLAEDVKDDYLIAVKVLYPQFGEDLSYVQRFNREAKLASTLTDPHIVRVLDYGADRDIYYLVMEYIEGQDLRDLLKDRGPFQWKAALDIIDQLATALEHAHQHNVVHRDIKPQNMMIENDSGLLKVLDFGIARIPTLPSLTQSGFVGSPYYVSPEQAMGEEVDIRSDIYSSGIVLYELLSGNIPFDAKSPWSIISQHISSDPPPIEFEADDDVPEGIHSLIERMVTKRPEDRFQTPTALRRAIGAVLAGQPVPHDTLDTRLIISADQQAEMAESLYQRALEAIDAQEWARAVDLLNQVIALNPDHTEAAEKLTRAKQESILISLYAATKRSIRAGNWEDAVNNLNGIIELNPDYKDVQDLLGQARQALEKENTQQFVITRYNEGVAHFEAGRWEEAIEAFTEVQRLVPGYERVEELITEAERLNNPGLLQRLAQALPKDARRWGLVSVGILAIILMVFFTFGNRNAVVGDDDPGKEQLKALYEQTQLAIERGEVGQAIALLDEILEQDPDYANAAALKGDLIKSLTPTPTPLPTPTATPTEDPVGPMMNEAQENIQFEQWNEAIALLQTIRETRPEFEEARIASLFCDAYVGRGLEALANIRQSEMSEQGVISEALADFEAGAIECPKRVDLQDQAERARAYLEVLYTSRNEYDTLIQILTPLVAADANYADGNAKKLLFLAYLGRGDARSEASEIVGALSDYEAALALNVEDPSEVQTRRAELLLSFSQQPATLTPQPVETAESGSGTSATATPTTDEPTPEPVRIKYGRPTLIAPEDDVLFAGRLFEEAILEWEPVDGLAEDEYYDLTIMYIFADQPKYWGMATTETQFQLTSEIPVGEAGGDRFYWWVTVRKSNSAPTPDSIDLPVSLRSEARTFVWTP